MPELRLVVWHGEGVELCLGVLELGEGRVESCNWVRVVRVVSWVRVVDGI